MPNNLSKVPADAFTISAILIGFLLIDDLNPAEQNSIGNWFMMIGQVLCTNSAQQQVINNNNNQTATPPIVNNNSSIDVLKRSMEKVNAEVQKY